ncbi:MAG: Na+/H+ antiporter subunit E [Desulfuromonadales bacterium]|nr:Na+/H+ antiporter subunit E [Desulfuromonadales bacterium]
MPTADLERTPPWSWREASTRLAFLTGLWLLLTGADAGSWVIGGPAVLLATLLSLRLRSPVAWRWRPAGLLRFVPYFLWHSLRGGLDVTRRALHPRLPIAPALVYHTLRLPPGPSRVFLANTINLLPGTLSAELQDSRLTVHMLDAALVNVMELQRLETRVADLFAVSLE